jgi:hypothetical protein
MAKAVEPILWHASSKILTPHGPTPSPPGECVPPAFGAGGTHSMGGRLLEDARHCSVFYIRKYFVI